MVTMKKVISPFVSEISEYTSDFSGKNFDDTFGIPPVTITISCGYGSEFDGSKMELHLTDKDLLEIVDFLKLKLSNAFKADAEKKILEASSYYDNAIEDRDHTSCELFSNEINLYEAFLGIRRK